MPYIFSKDLIRNLLTECDNIKPHPLSNRHLVFPAVYRLLYGCGVRISEAVKLRLKDVDLKQGIVVVRAQNLTKTALFHVSFVNKIPCRVFFKIHTVSSPQDYFFMKRDRTAYSSNTVYRNFRVLRKSGISHGGKGRGPQLWFAPYLCGSFVKSKWYSKELFTVPYPFFQLTWDMLRLRLRNNTWDWLQKHIRKFWTQ